MSQKSRKGRWTSFLRYGIAAAAVLAALPLFMSFGPVNSFSVTMQAIAKGGATTGEGTGTITYYMAPGMMRMDLAADTAPSGPASQGSSILLFQKDQVVNIVLVPSEKKYLETTMTRQEYEADPSNFDAMFAQPDSDGGFCHETSTVECKNIGSDTLAGQRVQKWTLTTKNSDGTTDTGTVWYDAQLHFVLQALNKDGSGFVVKNVSTTTPAASLFEVPSDYSKLTY